MATKRNYTTSADRSKGKTNKPITRGQEPFRSNRQRVSTAQVSSSETRASGGTARVTRNQDSRRPPSGAGRVDNTNVGPQSTGRQLPPQGGTNAGSARASNERAWTRDRGARAQLQRGMTNLARGAARMAGVDRQSVAGRKLDAAAQGTRGDGVREGRPRPELGRPRTTAATSSRIEPVTVRDVTPRRQALPPGQRGGDISPSSRGAVANIPEPRPRPGGRVVVDESPRLPPGQRGGDLATRDRRGEAQNRANRAAAGESGGSRTGNSSQPWGDRPQRGNSSRVPSSRALPSGQRGGDLARSPGGALAGQQPPTRGSLATRSRGGSLVRSGGGSNSAAASVARGAARGAMRGGLAGAVVAGVADRLLGPVAERAGTALGQEIRQRMTPQRTGTPSGRTGRGGTTNDTKGRVGPAVPDRLTKQSATRSQTTSTRQLRLAQSQGSDRPSPAAASGSSYEAPRRSSGGSTPARGQMAAPGAAGRQSAAPATQPSGTREWKDFNPGRGTSRTNNPLIQKDEWLLGKIKQREQASADAAVNSGKASPARYNVQASPAEYNVSQEEGEKRLRIRRKKQEN